MLLALLALATEAQVKAAPPPLRAFLARRESCDHWAGEEPYDTARRAAIERAMRSGRCDRIGADAAILRHRYRHRADLLRLLADPDA